MGAQFKGFTPFTIHFRVKAMLNDSLRRHYLFIQSGVWAAVFFCLAGIVMLICLRVSLKHYSQFNSHPVTIVSGLILAAGGVGVVAISLYFRCIFRPEVVHFLEKADRRRGRIASRRARIYEKPVTLEQDEGSYCASDSGRPSEVDFDDQRSEYSNCGSVGEVVRGNSLSSRSQGAVLQSFDNIQTITVNAYGNNRY